MILCCGEALIDMIPTPTKDGQFGYVPHSGGAVFNTAIALGRLGVEAGMLTALSNDMFGDQLLSDLQASHVDTTHVVRSDHPSTLAFVQVTDGQARYAFFDENTAERCLRPQDIPALAPVVSALYFGGISLAREPGALAYSQLAERAHDAHVVMLDPNIRPGFIEDEATYRARLDSMIAYADILKVSDEDLDWLCPTKDGLDTQVTWVQRAGPSVVIVTEGADGATAWLSNGDRARSPSPSVDVADTVGAGDTFNAGVLAELHAMGVLTKPGLKQLTVPQMQQALSFGAQVAAITVSRVGADPPWREELPAG